MLIATACQPPVAIKTVAPAFPKSVLARTNGRDLSASVRIVVSPQGSISDVSIQHTTGIPIFDDAATAAVKQWQFQPSMAGCETTPYSVDVSFQQVPIPSSYDPCAHDAFVLSTAMPEYPDAARVLGLSHPSKVAVDVTVDDRGKIERADITPPGSSGIVAIDEAALGAARYSTYAPKVVNCKPVVGHFMFHVEFDPN